MTENKRFFIDLALKAFRKRQSQQTGFVHYSYENPAHSLETIPFYENALFALALFRSRLSDDVLEGKELMQKLLHFRVEGNFPIYLHEYPACKDRNQPFKVLPILVWLLREFSVVLGEELRTRLNESIEKIVSSEELIPKNSLLKKEAYLKKEGIFDQLPLTATDVRDYLIALYLRELPKSEEEKILRALSASWDPHLMTFVGNNGDQKQDRREPQVTHVDFFMGQLFDLYSPRWEPSLPIAMHAALVPSYPYPPFEVKEKTPFVWIDSTQKGMGVEILFGNAGKIHSITALCGEFNEMECSFVFNSDEDRALLFVDHSPEHTLYVNGVRATVFALSDTVEIRSKESAFFLRFRGEGRFLGRISKGNRPSQIGNKGELKYAAFDHQISVEPIGAQYPQTVYIEIGQVVSSGGSPLNSKDNALDLIS